MKAKLKTPDFVGGKKKRKIHLIFCPQPVL